MTKLPSGIAQKGKKFRIQTSVNGIRISSYHDTLELAESALMQARSVPDHLESENSMSPPLQSANSMSPPLQSESPPGEILELIKQALGETERLIESRDYQDALREVKCIRAILTRRKYI